jgi:hypothetical protein
VSEPVASEPTAAVLHAVVRLLGICSVGMDADDLSAVAVQAALDEFEAIAADEPRSVLSAAAVRTAELFLLAANAPLLRSGGPRPAEPAEPWELASATGGLRVLLAALSVASTVDLIDSCLEQE